MAEPMRTLTEPDQGTARYQPLSLFAILAICVAGAFTLSVVLLTAVGLISRKPVLQPMLILAAVAGVVLSIAARWQIRNAEGTLAGTRMAKLAMWLSILFGCCYVAYFYGNAFAIQQQAKDFVANQWLKAMQDHNIEKAALLTLPPHLQQGMTDQTVSARYGETVTALRQLEFTRIMDRAGADADISLQGVKEWKETSEGAFEVSLNYLIKTREGEFDVGILVTGSEAKDSQGRQWSVRANAPFIRSRRLSIYGRMLIELQFEAAEVIRDWVGGKLAFAQFDTVYLYTLPMPMRTRKVMHEVYVSEGLVGTGLAAATTPGGGLDIAAALGVSFGDMSLNRQIHLNGYLSGFGLNKEAHRYEDYARKLIVFDERARQPTKSAKEELIPRLIHPAVITMSQSANLMEVPTHIEVTPTEIRVSYPMDFVLPVPLSYRTAGRVVAVCSDKELVAKVNDYATRSWNGSMPVEESNAESAVREFTHDWRVTQAVVDLSKRITQRPGGPPPGLPSTQARP